VLVARPKTASRGSRAFCKCSQVINTAVVRIFGRDQLLQEACRLAHTTGGYAFAYVALVEPGEAIAK
jgi:hypothetical protein